MTRGEEKDLVDNKTKPRTLVAQSLVILGREICS
jgi:hypothetical protein